MVLNTNLAGIIDARASGVSGDKYLGALIDLGAKPKSLNLVAQAVAQALPGTKRVDVHVETVERGGVSAKLVSVSSKEDVEERKGSVIRSSIQKAASKIGLSDWGKTFAINVVDTLLEAESHVHGHSTKSVTLHELGSADTLVDILGVAYLIEELEISSIRWWSSPIAVGKGNTRFSGREYPIPPPAVAEILRRRKYPMEQGGSKGELSTPTGVAITTTLAPDPSRSYPAIRPERIGYGAGSKDLEQVANVLRIMTGQSEGASHSHDEVVILETNLDDVSGEIIGRTVDRLTASGARDVTITPVYMKKNRPGHMITVIAGKQDAEALAEVLMTETGTFGVRELPVTRHVRARSVVTLNLVVKHKSYPARVKISKDSHGVITGGKFEYEDLRGISDKSGIAVRELQRLGRPLLETLFRQGANK